LKGYYYSSEDKIEKEGKKQKLNFLKKRKMVYGP
jgi:hypothetical protein